MFLSFNASIGSIKAFPSLRNSDHVVVSVSIDFPSNSKWDAQFHCIAYDYSCADWDDLRDHLRDVPREDIFKVGASAAVSEFCEWVQAGIDVYIRPSLTHLRGFQLLVMLPSFLEITFFVFSNRINLLNLKESSDRLVIVAKGFLKLPNRHMLLKEKSPLLSRNLVLGTFGELLIVFSTKVNLLYLLFSAACFSHVWGYSSCST